MSPKSLVEKFRDAGFDVRVSKTTGDHNHLEKVGPDFLRNSPGPQQAKAIKESKMEALDEPPDM